MAWEAFKHKDPDEYHDKVLSLHDCIADQILLEENTLRFCLPDGFWITSHHEENKLGKTVRTDASMVSFSTADAEDITIRVFTRNTCPWSRKTSVENWHIRQLIAAVNAGKCTLEFITQYTSHYEQMWHCAIHSRKKPYYMECQLYLPETEATYFWNDLRPECEW